jgi:hypothetical protein
LEERRSSLQSRASQGGDTKAKGRSGGQKGKPRQSHEGGSSRGKPRCQQRNISFRAELPEQDKDSKGTRRRRGDQDTAAVPQGMVLVEGVIERTRHIQPSPHGHALVEGDQQPPVTHPLSGVAEGGTCWEAAPPDRRENPNFWSLSQTRTTHRPYTAQMIASASILLRGTLGCDWCTNETCRGLG